MSPRLRVLRALQRFDSVDRLELHQALGSSSSAEKQAVTRALRRLFAEGLIEEIPGAPMAGLQATSLRLTVKGRAA